MHKHDSEVAYLNLHKFVKYEFDTLKEFYDRFESLFREDNPNLTDTQIKDKRGRLQKIIRKEVPFGPEWRPLVERLFDLPIGTLNLPVINKKTAYVLVNCRGNDAHKLFLEVSKKERKWEVVDECSMIAGTADIFLRLYGTEESISEILTRHIYSIKGVEIQRTNTLFAFDQLVWQRYSSKELSRAPNRPYWLKEKTGKSDRSR